MTIIQAGKYGRLGNRLILAAHLLAFAKEHNHLFIDFGFDEYGDFFSGIAGRPFLSWPSFPISIPFASNIRTFTFKMSRHLTVGERPKHLLGNKNWFEHIYLPITQELDLDQELNQEILVRLINAKLVICDAWWIRNTNLVAKHSDFLIDFFRLIPSLEKEIKTRIDNLKSDTDYLIGVHIRREDYRDVAPHLIFRDHYWQQLLIELEQIFYPHKVKFVICSNEVLEWEDIKDNYFIQRGDPVFDMYMLSSCDYIIGIPSTFSEWAAFVGRKKICVLRSESLYIKIESFKTVDSPFGVKF